MPFGNVSRKRRRQKDEEKYDDYEDVYEEMFVKKTVFERWFHEETGFEEIVKEKIVRGRKRTTRALRGSGLAETDADSGVSDSCSDTTATEAIEDDDAPGEETKPRRTGCYSLNLKQIPPHANDVTSARPGNHLHRSAPPNLETTRTRTRTRRKWPFPARRSSAKATDECSSSWCDSSSGSEAESACTYECECGYKCKCRSPRCSRCFDEDDY